MSELVQWIATEIDEKRSIAYSNLEVRAENEGKTLVGYAAVWDSPSEYMGFTEFVKRGAFSKTLNDGADVRLLIDHEGVPLARSKSGTLALEEDERGLRVEADLDPMNPDSARILSAMKRGDISQMSFASGINLRTFLINAREILPYPNQIIDISLLFAYSVITFACRRIFRL